MNVQGRGVQSRLRLRLSSSGATPVNPGRLPVPDDKVEYKIVKENDRTYLSISGQQWIVKIRARQAQEMMHDIMERMVNARTV